MESPAICQSLLEFTTDCIKLLDLDARLLFINRGGCKALEIDDFSGIANTCWLDFWKGSDYEAAREAIQAARAGGVGHFQGYCPTWKGTPKWWDVVITPILDAHAQPERLVVSSRDISDARQAEDQLRATLESLGDGFVAFDAEWRFLYVNQAAERLSRMRREDLLGRTIWEVFPLTVGTNLEREFRRVAAGEPSDFENFFEPWGGWFHSRCFPRAGGGISVYFQDITERKRSQDDLRATLQQLQLITENMPAGVVRYSRDHRYVWVSNRYANRMGRSPEEICGRSIPDVLGDEYYQAIRPHIERVLSGDRVEFDIQVKSHEGHPLWFHAGYVPDRDLDNKIGGWIGVITEITERKQAENALRESEERLRRVSDNADVGLTRCSHDWVYLSANPSYARIVGKPLDHIVGRPIAEVMGAEAAEAIRPYVERVLLGEHINYEAEVPFESVGPRHLHVNYTPDTDAAGQVVGWVACVTDITERKQADAALRESEERLTLAQNAAQLGVWDSDLKTNVIAMWGKYAQLHGLSPDRTTITREEWLSLIHPEDREKVVALRQEARERTHTFDAEFRVIWPEGSTHWVHAKGLALSDDSGRPSRSTGVIWDITDRKLADAKLRDSEERFRRVFEEGPLGIALAARDHRFLIVNSAFCQMLGYPEEEVIQKTFADITHPDDVRADMELAEQLFKREIPFYRMQKRYVKKSGEIIWVNLTASVISGPDGEPLHRLTMIEDITEIKRTQEEARVRQKLQSVGTLASGIAHDFNNLLGAVLAQAELAQAEVAAGSIPKSELEAIRDVAIRGSEIVRQLMIYAGNESESIEVINVSQVVEEILPLLKISVSKHARIETDLSPHLPAIRASTAQVSQLVMNLGTNASEAIGDRDGVIRMTTRRVMVGHNSRKIERLPEGQYVELEVSDTGCGMLPETQERVFDPFFSTKSEGRGLGLAVVYGIVRDLGGAINLVSEAGHGTTFQIMLPCAETNSGTICGPVSDIGQAAPTSQTATVLVVEDEDLLRQAVSTMLGKHGFSVIEARDGSAALDAIRGTNNPIHVLVLDITLPGASGREVLQEARRLRPEMRIVVASAYPEEMATTSLQSAFERFIRKPYRVGDVVQLIRLIAAEPLAARHVHN